MSATRTHEMFQSLCANALSRGFHVGLRSSNTMKNALPHDVSPPDVNAVLVLDKNRRIKASRPTNLEGLDKACEHLLTQMGWWRK